MNMKSLVCFFLIYMSSLSALPLGNPSAPGFYTQGLCAFPHFSLPLDSVSYRLGYTQDHVYNRHVRFDNALGTDIHRLSVITYAGEIALNACERLDVFATVGASSLSMSRFEKYFDTAARSTPLILETESAFSWSIGSRGILWKCGPLQVGVEGEYFSTKMPITSTYVELGFNIAYPISQSVKYQEWQVGGGASLDIPIGCNLLVVPYIGVIGGQTWIDFGDLTQTFSGFALSTTFVESFPDLQNQKSIGYAVGITLVGCSRLSLGIEGRFASEKAFNFNSSCRF